MTSSAAAYQQAKLENVKKLKKQYTQSVKSLSRKIEESDLYDWNPTARSLLGIIARLQIQNEDAFYPPDAPDEFRDNRMGWCWMSQARLGLRLGKDEDRVYKIIKKFKEDKVIEERIWIDDNHRPHAEYQVNEKMVDAHQRPSQEKDVERPPRYKTKRGANRGSFSASNQPQRVRPEIAETDEDEFIQMDEELV
jgi:hypothetical protein